MPDTNDRTPTFRRLGIPIATKRLVFVALGLAVLTFVVTAVLDRLSFALDIFSLLIFLAVITDLLTVLSPRKLYVQRRLSRRLILGQEADITVEVTNHGKRAGKLIISDSCPPSLRAEAFMLELKVPARGDGRVIYPVHPVLRGELVIHDMVVQSIGFFGLVGLQHRLLVEDKLLVNPAFQ